MGDLPAKDKLRSRATRALQKRADSARALPGDAGSVFGGWGFLPVITTDGRPAHTFQPGECVGRQRETGGRATFKVPAGYTTALFVLREIRLADGEPGW